MTEPKSPTSTVLRRDVAPDELAAVLRLVLGLRPEPSVRGELATGQSESSRPIVRGLDVGGWLAWCLSGVDLFGEGVPTMRRARTEARRAVAALAMVRAGGNITIASKALGTSRKSLRELLRATGLYPWNPAASTPAVPTALRPGFSPFAEPCPTLAANQAPQTPPRCPCATMATPTLIEDGTKGTVRLDLTGIDAEWGPATLERGDRADLLFDGWWVHRETARTYAHTHGHEFRDGT